MNSAEIPYAERHFNPSPMKYDDDNDLSIHYSKYAYTCYSISNECFIVCYFSEPIQKLWFMIYMIRIVRSSSSNIDTKAPDSYAIYKNGELIALQI